MPRRPEAPPPSATATATEDEDHLEDYSWTAFWSRARELGLNKAAIEERLGRPTHGLSPRQLREALEQTGIDFGD
jgi:TPP-dependent indolepyruvate ferredoxin oxidoreductase alpha subunit